MTMEHDGSARTAPEGFCRAIGLRVKSGYAIAVVLGGPASDPKPVARHIVALSDPDVPETRQPHHDGLALQRAGHPWPPQDAPAAEVHHLGVPSRPDHPFPGHGRDCSTRRAAPGYASRASSGQSSAASTVPSPLARS